MCIECYDVDGNSICARYVPALAGLGLPGIPVHTDSNATNIPSGYAEACFLS